MKIVQLTKAIDNETLKPVALITLEAPIAALLEHLAKGDEAIERFVGREFLNAMHAILKEDDVQDVEVKNTKENHDAESAAVS